jgi:predicted transcriptional regulator
MINRNQIEDELTPEEQAELDAAIAEADLGGGIPAEEVLRELRVRTRREEHARRG